MMAATTPAPRARRPVTNRLFLWVSLNILLGLVMSASSALATLHAWLFALAAIAFAATTRDITLSVAVAAYAAGCDTLWRTTDASFFYEGAKYLVTGCLLLCFLRLVRASTRGIPAIAYFLLLLPSIAVMVTEVGLVGTRDLVSSHLSGPLCLAAAAFVCLSLRASWSDAHTIFLALLGPLITLSTVVLIRAIEAGRVNLTSESSLSSSGGFGPNQVSAALGLGALIALVLVVVGPRTTTGYKLVAATVCVWMLGQSALTFGRGGAYNFGAGAIALISVRVATGGDRLRVLGRVVVLVFAGIAAFVWLNSFTDGALERRFDDRSTSHRDEIARSDLQVFLDHPLVGVGPGRASEYRDAEIGGRTTHTEYTRLIAEHGVLGVMAAAALVLMAYRAVSSAPNQMSRAVTLCFLTWALVDMTHAGMRVAAPSIMFGLAMLRIDHADTRPRESARKISRSRPLVGAAAT